MDIGDAFKALIWDALISAALKSLFSALPFLGWGPIGWVVSYLAHWVADKVFEGVDEYIDLQIIAFRKKELAQEYTKQTISLRGIAETHGVESEEFKIARESAKMALRDFIKFNG